MQYAVIFMMKKKVVLMGTHNLCFKPKFYYIKYIKVEVKGFNITWTY